MQCFDPAFGIFSGMDAKQRHCIHDIDDHDCYSHHEEHRTEHKQAIGIADAAGSHSDDCAAHRHCFVETHHTLDVRREKRSKETSDSLQCEGNTEASLLHSHLLSLNWDDRAEAPNDQPE